MLDLVKQKDSLITLTLMLVIKVVLDETKCCSVRGIWNVKVVEVLIIKHTKDVLKGLATRF